MNSASLRIPRSGVDRFKLFLALSRTAHGLLDMATPAFAALLWLGSFPPLNVAILGLATAFAGYTAVYALNDLVDYRTDKKRIDDGLLPSPQGDLDAIFIRHPVAQGLLPYKNALLWILAWSFLALAGAYILNPLCAVIFFGGCLLETVYCLMWKSSYLKILISGAVKTSGAMAAVFAVDPHPPFPPLILLFFLLFFWEIGGQNIPNDWADIEEDSTLKATTIPVRFGPALANTVIFLSLLAAVILSGVLPWFLPGGSRIVGLTGSLGAGMYFLLIPAYRLSRTGDRSQALALFNRASYYPVGLLGAAIATILF